MGGGYGTYGEVPSRSSRVPIVKFALVPFRELGDKSPPPSVGDCCFNLGDSGGRTVGVCHGSKVECRRLFLE